MPWDVVLIWPSAPSRGRWRGPQQMGRYRPRAGSSALGTGAGGRCGVVAGQRCRRPRPSAPAGRGVQASWSPGSRTRAAALVSCECISGPVVGSAQPRVLTPLRLPGQMLSLPSAPATLGKSARFTRSQFPGSLNMEGTLRLFYLSHTPPPPFCS